MRNKLIFLLAIVFALVTAFSAYKYLENLKETYRTSGNFSQVAVAKQRIAAKTPINEQMLEFKEMPVEYIMPGAIVDAKDAVGKLARSDIYPGEQILSNKLIGKNDPAGGLAAKVEKGKRAITVPVTNVTALHGLIGIGDHVDVMVTFDTPSEPSFAATSTIIQNVPVLAVNRKTEGTKGVQEDPTTATLMVSPVQAQQIALAIQQGSIQLMLRSPDDKAAPALPMSKIEHLLR
ncbi:pilus assembly protein CpaB [Desulfohalotomaculum tongense]|uniref:Flp pilus assembly protein CpaB n=1 Tax=Desulforadius tongensis TaxID=1216062 RepID=UPI0019565BA0|nr:Flp pilus assembly protein CpaB [Desulforadius tongensis]MBM7855619.1 pilus assembly protein CpaB [Desulforadius tongensis]